MFQSHFSKKDFIHSLESNQNLVIFLSTTFGLMLIMTLHSLIQGQLKLVYFAYAMIVSAAFYAWALIDNKFRKQPIKSFKCIQ